MLEEIKQDAIARMDKSTESFKAGLTKIRTGRAHPSLLSSIPIPYYGNDVPLAQVGNIAVGDARTLTITVWEKPMIPVVEKAIMMANLGLNPVTAGEVIRVPLPALTEERRRELAKLVRAESEQARVAIRNIRRDALSDAKDLLKEKEITEDQERKMHDQMQKLTDQHIANVDAVLKEKEQELMEI